MKNKRMRKAFSMIEIIFAIVLMTIVAGLIIVNVISNKRSGQITSTVQNDVQNIYNAAAKWRDQSADSDGTFNNISVSELCPYLPDSMQCDGTYIYSSGYQNGSGKGMIEYQVLSYKKSTDGDSFKIFMNAAPLANARNWTSREKQKIETVFDSVCKAKSTNKSVTIDNDATAIGSANAGFTDGGTATDGEAGVAGLTE